MAYRDLGLRVYQVMDIKKDMVQIFDSDYNGDNGDESFEYWELLEDGTTLAASLGFETEAARLIDKIYDGRRTAINNMENIMEQVEMCWGSYCGAYEYIITPMNTVQGYLISVAMTT